jgi:hypothetical protein
MSPILSLDRVRHVADISMMPKPSRGLQDSTWSRSVSIGDDEYAMEVRRESQNIYRKGSQKTERWPEGFKSKRFA